MSWLHGPFLGSPMDRDLARALDIAPPMDDFVSLAELAQVCSFFSFLVPSKL